MSNPTERGRREDSYTQDATKPVPSSLHLAKALWYSLRRRLYARHDAARRSRAPAVLSVRLFALRHSKPPEQGLPKAKAARAHAVAA